ncbi:MAG: hypothetical protein JEZ14_08320 [Marinilabiliaceae bacterium]|nr:hypothetical protein [Marinilabiliaceae bacterium]
MGKLLILLLRLLKGPVQWIGADYNQFEALLRAKLKMDFRRTPGLMQASGQKNHKFGWQLGMFVFLGLFLVSAFYQFNDFLFLYAVFFSVLMVMTGTTLISEFTSVLFDERENQILLPRPVSDRTLLLVRLVHIQIYLGLIAVALSVGTLILTVIKFGPMTVLALLPAIVCASWITLLLATFLYLGLSKLVSGERFKDIVNYFQIVMAVVIFGGFQIMPHAMDAEGVQNLTLGSQWWIHLLPTVWLAGFTRFFTAFSQAGDVVFLVVTLGFTLLGSWVMIRYFARGFDRIIAADNAADAPVDMKRKSEPPAGFFVQLKNWFCVSNVERSGWSMALTTAKRDRKFKQAAYPGFGIILVMLFMMLKPDFQDGDAFVQKLSESPRYLTFIFCGIFALTPVTQLSYTDVPEAAWIYKALPGQQTWHVLTGSVKALLLIFYVPVSMLLLLLAAAVWGVSIVPLLLCGQLLALVSFLWGTWMGGVHLPFSLPREMQNKSGKGIRIMGAFLMMGVVIGVVYGLSFLSVWITLLVAGLSSIFIVLFFRRVRRMAVC